MKRLSIVLIGFSVASILSLTMISDADAPVAAAGVVGGRGGPPAAADPAAEHAVGRLAVGRLAAGRLAAGQLAGSGSRWSGSRWGGSRWGGSRRSGSRWSGSRWSGSWGSGSRRGSSRRGGSQWGGSQWGRSQRRRENCYAADRQCGAVHRWSGTFDGAIGHAVERKPAGAERKPVAEPQSAVPVNQRQTRQSSSRPVSSNRGDSNNRLPAAAGTEAATRPNVSSNKNRQRATAATGPAATDRPATTRTAAG